MAETTDQSFYCWWRTAREFDDAGQPGPELSPARACDVAALPPRARVLREMERLALIGSESLDEARRRVAAYRPGDLYVPAGGVGRQQMEIPNLVSILVVGAEGSGKSSLVNLMHSVLGRSGLIPFARTSPSATTGSGGRTKCLEEHNVLRSTQSGFCVFDTKGFDYDSLPEGLREMSGWVRYGVRHRQICPGTSIADAPLTPARTIYARRKVNCIIVVANISEIYQAYKVGDMKPLEATRQIFSAASSSIHNEDPILVLTHGDQLSTDQRLEARLRVCKHLGVSETSGAYDIACLNEYGLLVEECDPATAYSVVEAVYRALIFADQHYTAKRSFLDWFFAIVYWIMGCLANFFAFLSKFFSQFTNNDHKLKFS